MPKSVKVSSLDKKSIKEFDNLEEDIFEKTNPLQEAHLYSESIQKALFKAEKSPLVLTDETEFIIVEKNKPICLSLTKYLKKLGFQKIRFCSSVVQGTAMFENFVNSEKLPIVFIGENLMDENPNEMLSFIFRTNPETKIILLTAQKDDLIIKKALEMGAFGFLEKPISLSSVKKIITNIQEDDSSQEITFLH